MSTPTKTQALPILANLPARDADEIRTLAQTVQRLTARIQSLESAGFITGQDADSRYGPQVMAQALSATGSNPLNVVQVGSRYLLQAQPTRRK